MGGCRSRCRLPRGSRLRRTAVGRAAPTSGRTCGPVRRLPAERGVVLDMQSFVGKLTHACPVYYCSRSARPRALPAGLSVVAADWPHVSNSGYDGSSGIQHHHLGLGVGFEFRHEVPPRRLRRASRHPRVVGQVRREDREHVLRPSTPWADSGCASAVNGPLRAGCANDPAHEQRATCAERRAPCGTTPGIESKRQEERKREG